MASFYLGFIFYVWFYMWQHVLCLVTFYLWLNILCLVELFISGIMVCFWFFVLIMAKLPFSMNMLYVWLHLLYLLTFYIVVTCFCWLRVLNLATCCLSFYIYFALWPLLCLVTCYMFNICQNAVRMITYSMFYDYIHAQSNF